MDDYHYNLSLARWEDDGGCPQYSAYTAYQLPKKIPPIIRVASPHEQMPDTIAQNIAKVREHAKGIGGRVITAPKKHITHYDKYPGVPVTIYDWVAVTHKELPQNHNPNFTFWAVAVPWTRPRGRGLGESADEAQEGIGLVSAVYSMKCMWRMVNRTRLSGSLVRTVTWFPSHLVSL